MLAIDMTRRTGEPLSGPLGDDFGSGGAHVAARPANRSSGRSGAPCANLESATKLRDAAVWLVDLLKRGPLESKEVGRLAAAGEFGWRTVQRAKERAGVTVAREGFGRGARYVWMLEAMRAKPEPCVPTLPCVPTAAACVPPEPSVPAAPCVPADPCVPSPQIGTHGERRLEVLSEADREAFEERAAIMQFDGGLSEVDAEAEAWRLIEAAGRKAQAAT